MPLLCEKALFLSHTTIVIKEHFSKQDIDIWKSNDFSNQILIVGTVFTSHLKFYVYEHLKIAFV